MKCGKDEDFYSHITRMNKDRSAKLIAGLSRG